MGRKKLKMKKIENPTSRQVTYSKRKDGIVKKASELSVLCDIDVGLIMFSPSGRLTSFASNGSRIEDIFLRYIDRPDDLRGGGICNEEHLYHSLMQLKYEAEMLQKLEEIEALEETLHGINQRRREAEEKMKFYNPEPEKIFSVHEAQAYQQFIVDAIRHIERTKVNLAEHNNDIAENHVRDTDQLTEESVDSNRLRKSFSSEQLLGEPAGPHLSISYLMRQNHWNLLSGGGGGGGGHEPGGLETA